MSIFKKEKEIITPDGEVVIVPKQSFWERIKPKNMTEMEWERWRRKNINLNGFGKLCWIIARFIIIFGISFMILYPFLVKGIVSFMSTNDITDKTVMYLPREGSTYFIDEAPQEVWNLYREELVQIYATSVRSFFQSASNRNSYSQGVELIRKLIAYGGKAEADMIVSEQKSRTPRRPALIDELSKL